MNIAEWLAASARQWPEAPALLAGTRVVADYANFARRAGAIAARLVNEYQISPGDQVAVFMKNCTQYLECLYGIWWAGAVAIPINAKLHQREAAWICTNAEARIAFVCDEKQKELQAEETLVPGLRCISVDGDEYGAMSQGDGIPAPVSREDEDIAWLFYTSGTTGRPKGVMLSHRNLMAMSLCYMADVDQVSQHDAALYAAPMSHGAGLYNFIHVRIGARHVIPESGGFDADEVLDLAKRLRNVSMFAAPTMVKRLVDAARKRAETGDGIKTIVYGGGPMYLADIQDALDVMGDRFVQIYGQGESPMTITSLKREWHCDTKNPRYLERLASVGTAHSLVSVRITDGNRNPLPPGNTGEIEVKGAIVMRGYWKNDEATADVLKDGWLRTGDVGRVDEDGFLTLSDRSKDVIISGGSNIYPREVEEVLLSHPAIREISVVGMPDAEWGEVVVACVVLEDGMEVGNAELDAYCLASIARFKRPKHYLRLQELPKNNYGKVLKTALRESLSSLHKQG
jgi:long-chain acyl-CoA synthetase